LFSIIKIIKNESPQIVHTFDTKPNILGRIAAKICGVQIIIGTQPGLGILYSPNHLNYLKVYKWCFENLNKMICKLSDITIYQNLSDLELMLRKNIISNTNSCLIKSSGIDTNYFSFDERKLEIDLLESKKINVVLISRLIKSKGIIDFCELAKQIRKKYDNVIFNIVGNIPKNSPDKISINIFKKYNKHVKFLGLKKDVKKTLSESHLMVFPSRYAEGVPRVLLEAASMGLPLIAYENAGSNEVIHHNKNGYLIEKGNIKSLVKHTLLILKDKNIYKKFSIYSRKISKNEFDISIVAKHYKNLYNSLLIDK
jgi:N,N'-diacetylbacillosaminyl-diphospho-undecaprenol alpha-1,3-N-acetylgalactosaminyltransferase